MNLGMFLTSLKNSPRHASSSHASLRGSQYVLSMLLIGVAVLIGPASALASNANLTTVLQSLTAADVTVSTFEKQDFGSTRSEAGKMVRDGFGTAAFERSQFNQRALQESSQLIDSPCWTVPMSNPAETTVIDCRGKGLQGTIPLLDSLTALKALYLDGNQLSGTIPPLSALTALLDLFLYNNRLEGIIPSLSALTALSRLALNNNALQGDIPPLSALSEVTILFLHNNNFQGAIPPLDALTALTWLSLYNNQLQGVIPLLSNLTALTRLSLYNNQLQGAIPLLSNLTTLTRLDLSNNQLQGAIPPLSNLTALTTLNLFNNQLQGAIPPLSNLIALTTLVLYDNQLQGTMPTLDDLTKVEKVSLQNNQLQGNIPSLSALTSLKEFVLSNNKFQGTIPPLSALTSLRELLLENNKLQGTIPPLSALTSLTQLLLNNNTLQGTIPMLSALTALIRVRLENNALSGALPDISTLNNLVALDIQNNSLSGVYGSECAETNVTNVNSFFLAGADQQRRRNGNTDIASGLFTKFDVPEGDDYQEQYPVFQNVETGSFLFSVSGFWIISNDLGSTTSVFLYVISDATHPLAIASNQWFEFGGFSFIANPNISLSCAPANNCEPGSYFEEDYTLLLSSFFSFISKDDFCAEAKIEYFYGVCVRCRAGRRSPGRGKPCIDCSKTTYCLEGSTEETSCPAGTYGNIEGRKTQVCSGLCSPGDYCPTGSERPSPCQPGYYCEDSSSQEECAMGFVSSKSAFECEKCPNGTKANNDRTACDVCALGEWAAEASMNCTSCPGGKYGGNLNLGSADDCTECDPGKFTDGGTLCELCPEGRHSNADLSACDACPAGTFGKFKGLSTKEDCTLCDPGTVGIKEGAKSSEEGCEECPPGKNAPFGFAECKDCEPGTIARDPGQSFCKVCPRGTYEVNKQECKPCAKGYFSKGYVTECLPCGERTFNDTEGAEFCSFCPEFQTTLGEGSSRCVCDSGYLRDLNGECKPCPKNAICDLVPLQSADEVLVDTEGENSILSLRIEPGWWRAGQETDVLRECADKPEYCTGNVNGSLCLEHHKGAFCLACEDGYADKGDGCVECSGEQISKDTGAFFGQLIAFTLVFGLVFCLFVRWRLTIIFDSTKTSRFAMFTSKAQHLFKKIAKFAVKFKILIGLAQVLASFGDIFYVNLPPAFTAFTQGLSFVGIDISSAFSTGCFFSGNHYTSLLVYTLVPAMIAGLGLGVYFALKRKYRDEASTMKKIYADCLTWFLVLTFVVYPGVSVTIFQTFYCSTFEDGSRFLRADYTIDCGAPGRGAWVFYAVLCALVYTVGILVLYVYLLRTHKHTLMKDRAQLTPKEKSDIEHLDFLVSAYEPKYYYYEIVEQLRKLAQTTLVVFLWNGTGGQLVLTMLLCLGAIQLLVEKKPYVEAGDDRLAVVAQWELFFVAFGALLFKVDVTDEFSESQLVFTVVLFAVVLGGPLSAFYGLVHEIYMDATSDGQDEDEDTTSSGTDQHGSAVSFSQNPVAQEGGNEDSGIQMASFQGSTLAAPNKRVEV